MATILNGRTGEPMNCYIGGCGKLADDQFSLATPHQLRGDELAEWGYMGEERYILPLLMDVSVAERPPAAARLVALCQGIAALTYEATSPGVNSLQTRCRRVERAVPLPAPVATHTGQC